MQDSTLYLLETLAVTIPASGVIGYIVYNLQSKLKVCRKTLNKVSDALAQATEVADALVAECKINRATIAELREKIALGQPPFYMGDVSAETPQPVRGVDYTVSEPKDVEGKLVVAVELTEAGRAAAVKAAAQGLQDKIDELFKVKRAEAIEKAAEEAFDTLVRQGTI